MNWEYASLSTRQQAAAAAARQQPTAAGAEQAMECVAPLFMNGLIIPLLLLCWRACYSNMRRRCCCAHQTILMECIKMSAGGSSGTASACGLSALLGAGHCWCIFLNSRGIEYYLHFHHIHIQTCILLGDLGFGSSNLKYLLL